MNLPDIALAYAMTFAATALGIAFGRRVLNPRRRK